MTAINSWTVNRWPFDMLKFLKYYTIIMHDDGTNLDMYEAYCGLDNNWVATKLLDSIIAYNPGVVYPLNWDFADFDWFFSTAFAYMDNGVVSTKCYNRYVGITVDDTIPMFGEDLVEFGTDYDPEFGTSTSFMTALPSDNCPTFITCCNFKGQPILGGIISTNPTWTQLGRASVCWGGIGQWEFRPSVNRTAGFIRMPWSDWDKGLVLKVAELGNRVVVYGNAASCSLIPYTKEHAVGFGLDDKVMGPGIQSGFHFAGDKDKHLIVGNDYNLYITNETGDFGKALGFKKLGYKEYIKDLIDQNNDYAEGTPLCLSYDSLRRRFYISGINSAYCLTEFGLYKHHQCTTGVGRYRGVKLAGFVKDLGDYEARMTGDSIDLRLRGMKTVETLEFGLDCGSNAYGGIDFKYEYDRNKSYRSGRFKPLSPNGVCYPLITASDFRIKFKSIDYRDGIKLDSINCKWKLSDKRSVRGLYNANKAQSGSAQ